MEAVLRKSIVLMAILAIAVPLPSTAQERFTPPNGGLGGQQFISRCPSGALLTGIVALTGAYINNIAPVCDGRALRGAGGRGERRSVDCPAGSVIQSVWFISLRSDNHLLKNLNVHCVARGTRIGTADIQLTTPGRFSGKLELYPHGNMDCGAQNITGLQGRAGDAVDALGLICG